MIICVNKIISQMNLHQDPGAFAWATFMAFIAFFLLGSHCFLGQQLLSSSEEIMYASYECIWYSQTMHFRKLFMIMRELALREMEISGIGYKFNRKTFTEVTLNK
jgi:hypothetical protein